MTVHDPRYGHVAGTAGALVADADESGSGVSLLPGCWSGTATLPGSAFGESPQELRLATGSLNGDSEARQEEALAAPDPLTLPWIAGHVARLEEILADLSP